eukprot:TRINITY_DN42239_c0_g1_i1.p1 TRINITY_DN42239_c0_g1~~TRINITY_DN42239_c0_g1_i1.p1  ORF type:complete len:389 (+),score=105.27 TRINITY_DN42239_c0_g1_i1:79-1245(+)
MTGTFQLPPAEVSTASGRWAVAASCSSQGIRPSNEDAHVLLCDGLEALVDPLKEEKPAAVASGGGGGGGLFDDLPEVVSGPSLPPAEPTHHGKADCLFAVLDGHGGPEAAKLCAERLPIEVRDQLEEAGRDTPEDRKKAVTEVFLKLDRYLRIKMGTAAAGCGSTCVFCFAWPEEAAGKDEFGLLVGNLGDSRALVLKAMQGGRGQGRFSLLGETSDHSPSKPGEERRIVAAGGTVGPHPEDKFQVARIDGRIGCSRALGDFDFKDDAALLPADQKLSIVPDVYEFRCAAGDAIVLCCDGVFDVLTSEEVVRVVGEALDQSAPPEKAANAVVNAALKARSGDNVTCVVALLGGEASASKAAANGPTGGKREAPTQSDAASKASRMRFI